MKERIILLLDMDAFFAMVEERENPHFKGKPVVVGADPKEGKGRGVVSTCNYKARAYGIHSAMPISQVWRLCPQAVFLPVDAKLYSEVSKRIMEIIQAACPGCPVEQVSLDEAYLDVTYYPTLKYRSKGWEKAEKIAKKLRKEIWNREQLFCSIGIGPNKMTAKIACEKAKPSSVRYWMSNVSEGIMVVKPQKVQDFLDPLPIRDIPGVGPKTAAILKRFFTKRELKVKDSKKATKEELGELLGVFGNTLYDRVRGIDDTPVSIKEEIKSIGKEHTFEKDTRDGEEIFPIFRELILNVVEELREREFSVKTVTVVCRFQGFETRTRSKTLKVASQDWKMFEKEAMRLLLKFLAENLKPVRLIGVRVRVAVGEAE